MAILLVLVPVLTWCRGQGVRTDEGDSRFWVTTPADSLLAEKVLAGLKGTPMTVAELMVRAGKMLEGQPYVAGTLDDPSGGQKDSDTWKEELRIYLTRTDCIIFVETCLALARTARQDGDFQMFANEIRQSRYRGGHVSVYADRLHYTTEWCRQGVARGVLDDLTRTLGGEVLDREIDYMSSHPGSYPLMDDVDAIREAERTINAEPIHYIPKSKVAGALGGIRSGDIICLVSAAKGLDVAHVGLALVEGGKVRLLHASTGPMKVTADPRTLQEYLAGRNSIAGIQVFRPLDFLK
jgi:hypothetical protein